MTGIILVTTASADGAVGIGIAEATGCCSMVGCGVDGLLMTIVICGGGFCSELVLSIPLSAARCTELNL